jgi:hypothetical protein
MKDVQIRKEESKVLLFENNPRYVYIWLYMWKILKISPNATKINKILEKVSRI